MADPWEVVSVAPAAQTSPWDVVSSTPLQKRSWMDVPGEALSNILPSAANMASGLYEAVTNPVKTVSGVLDVAAGGLQNALPKPVVDFVNKFDADPQAAQRAVQAANAAGGMLKDRYGSEDALKKTFATDPVGAVGDLSLLLTGGGSIAARTPMLAKAAPVLKTAATYTDPLNIAAKAGGKMYELAGALTKQGLGLKTGVGTEPITQAVQAGRESNPAFIENLRGEVPAINVLEDAKTNLAQMNADKQGQYRSGMVNIKNDKSVLDLTGVESALKNAENSIDFKQSGIPKDAKAVEVLQKLREKIDQWKKLDPAEYHTPEGLDHLKQSLWEDFGKLGQEEKTAYSVGKQVYDSVKTEINKQAPEYAKVMKEYTDTSDLVKEIERSLSLGQKASADTAMRKLQSLMRNNVNTNYGQRLDLAQQLQAAGGKDIMPALAGQAMGDWTPRGIQRTTAGLEGMGAYAIGGPALAALDIAASSPRLVGESSYKYGQLANALTQGQQAASRAIPMTAKQARLAALLGAQSNPYAIGGQQ
jgi:hypothetical protein